MILLIKFLLATLTHVTNEHPWPQHNQGNHDIEIHVECITSNVTWGLIQITEGRVKMQLDKMW